MAHGGAIGQQGSILAKIDCLVKNWQLGDKVQLINDIYLELRNAKVEEVVAENEEGKSALYLLVDKYKSCFQNKVPQHEIEWLEDLILALVQKGADVHTNAWLFALNNLRSVNDQFATKIEQATITVLDLKMKLCPLMGGKIKGDGGEWSKAVGKLQLTSAI